MSVSRSLCEGGWFWVEKRVTNGVKEEGATNILIGFRKWAL